MQGGSQKGPPHIDVLQVLLKYIRIIVSTMLMQVPRKFTARLCTIPWSENEGLGHKCGLYGDVRDDAPPQ